LAREVGKRLQEALDRGDALTAEERAAVAVETFKSKVHATRTALALTTKIFEVTGARATASKYGFDLYWRNVRTHTLHDPVLYKAVRSANTSCRSERQSSRSTAEQPHAKTPLASRLVTG
jgi:alkylation response protein AidB-like acyl-CoA dehydrogenase